MPRTTTGLIMAVLLLTGCGTEPTTAPPSPTPTQEVTVTPTQKPKLSPAEQARTDEQLRTAAWDNDVKAAKKLIARGADVNAKDDTIQSAYLISTSEGYLDLLRLTLAHGAEVNDKDSWNGTGLIRAAERGHYLVVGQLLQSGIQRDHVNRIGFQAIHESVWLGEDDANYWATIRVLAAGGVELDRPSDNQNLTPLEMARSKGFEGSERILEMLTSSKPPANPDAALLRAAQEGDPNAAALALRAGADIETRDEKRRTPLLLAVTGDHPETAKLLVALGADADALDAQHDTPWLVTGVTGSVEMLETLLPARPDLTIVNRYGGTSLIPASERGHVDYVRRAVRTGIDVNHINKLHWTALLEAVILGDGGPRHQKIVKILLANGADRSIADGDGVTALQHARDKGYTEIAKLLA